MLDGLAERDTLALPVLLPEGDTDALLLALTLGLVLAVALALRLGVEVDDALVEALLVVEALPEGVSEGEALPVGVIEALALPLLDVLGEGVREEVLVAAALREPLLLGEGDTLALTDAVGDGDIMKTSSNARPPGSAAQYTQPARVTAVAPQSHDAVSPSAAREAHQLCSK